MTHTHDPHAELEQLRKKAADLERENASLRRALTAHRAKGDHVTLCAGCKSVPDESGTWTPLESHLSSRYNMEFSHGLCPECAPRFGFRSAE